MKKSYLEIQQEVINQYHVIIDEHSTCWKRIHAHVRERRICKWVSKNSVLSTFTLFHEIGHIETKTSTMRRCESEYHATEWAIAKCQEYGITVPENLLIKYQEYIYREHDRGIRRGGNLPDKSELTLKCLR